MRWTRLCRFHEHASADTLRINSKNKPDTKQKFSVTWTKCPRTRACKYFTFLTFYWNSDELKTCFPSCCEVEKLLLRETLICWWWSWALRTFSKWSAGLRKRRFRTPVLQVKLNPCHRSGHELMERYWQLAGLSSSSPWKLTRGELARWGRGAFVRVKTAEKEKSFEAVEAAGRPDEKRQRAAGRRAEPGQTRVMWRTAPRTQTLNSWQPDGRKSLEEADFSLPPGPEQRLLFLLVLLFSRSFLAVKSSADSGRLSSNQTRIQSETCGSPRPWIRVRLLPCAAGNSGLPAWRCCLHGLWDMRWLCGCVCVWARMGGVEKTWHFYSRRAGLTETVSEKHQALAHMRRQLRWAL